MYNRIVQFCPNPQICYRRSSKISGVRRTINDSLEYVYELFRKNSVQKKPTRPTGCCVDGDGISISSGVKSVAMVIELSVSRSRDVEQRLLTSQSASPPPAAAAAAAAAHAAAAAGPHRRHVAESLVVTVIVVVPVTGCHSRFCRVSVSSRVKHISCFIRQKCTDRMRNCVTLCHPITRSS